MKGFPVHHTWTPNELDLADKERFKSWVELSHEDKDEARRAYAAGEYFREVKLSDLPS